MVLYFLRHGLAGHYGDPKYKDDGLRPLTLEGRKKMRREGLGMRALGLKFDVTISSPYLRARQTAEIIAEVYDIKKKAIHLTDNLLPPSPIEKLLREVRDHFPNAENVLLIGHEPHLTEMISSLLKSDEPLPIDLKKGGLCCLSTGPQKTDVVLNWLLTPTQLGLIGPITK